MSRFARIPLFMIAHGTRCRRNGGRRQSPPADRSAASAFPRLQSEYAPMPDGARLAVDVWLPAGDHSWLFGAAEAARVHAGA